jgi:phosphoglycolate phosphatase
MAKNNRGKRYQTIIWDWNGTLFDDAWLCVDIMNGMLQECGLPLMTPEKYAQIFDFPVRDYYARLGFDAQTDPFEKLSDRFIGEYLERKFECRLREGAEDTLQQLHSDGRQQLVLSAAKHDHLMRILEHFRLTDYFEAIQGIDNHHADGKLENALAMMQALRLNPDATLLVGDTLHDWEVAAEIGVDCLLIAGGHQSPERLAAAGANVIEHLSEVRKLVCQ